MTDKPIVEKSEHSEVHLSQYAKRAIRQWQEAMTIDNTSGAEKSLPHFKKFVRTIGEMLGAYTGNLDSQPLITILTGKDRREQYNDYLPIASGTAGQRIYFDTYILGEGRGETTRPISVKWMVYPIPESEIGMEYYTSFVSHFGTSQVDLTQEID